MEKNLRVGFLFFCCLVGIIANLILMFPQFWQAGLDEEQYSTANL